jgi:uncharacterized membrane protein
MRVVKRQVLVVAAITVIILLRVHSWAGVFSQVAKQALRRDKVLDFSILFAQLTAIPSHAIIALVAIVLGGIQLALPKGTTLHRLLGYVWVLMMLYVSISALFIHELRLIGPFSPIHILSFVVLYSLWSAIRDVRRGDIKAHEKTMKNLYFLALIITGGFTLLPGRVMHTVLFGV